MSELELDAYGEPSYPTPLTPSEAVEWVRKVESYDTEERHAYADQILLDLLFHFGATDPDVREVIDRFLEMHKWYA